MLSACAVYAARDNCYHVAAGNMVGGDVKGQGSMVSYAALREFAEEIGPGVVADRRYLHQHPELGFQEENTALCWLLPPSVPRSWHTPGASAGD